MTKTMTALTDLPSQHFEEWSLDFLADYIEQTHHHYIERETPVLLQLSSELVRLYGNLHPEFFEIDRLVHALMKELQKHMLHEETVLFPYIKRLLQAQGNRKQPVIKPFETVRHPLQAMEYEHKRVLEILERIRSLSNDFTAPLNAPATYGKLLHKLREFAEDLQQHTELENEVLFPKAIALEIDFDGDAKYQNRWFC